MNCPRNILAKTPAARAKRTGSWIVEMAIREIRFICDFQKWATCRGLRWKHPRDVLTVSRLAAGTNGCGRRRPLHLFSTAIRSGSALSATESACRRIRAFKLPYLKNAMMLLKLCGEIVMSSTMRGLAESTRHAGAVTSVAT